VELRRRRPERRSRRAHHEAIPFTLPGFSPGTAWQAMVDTSYGAGLAVDGRFQSGTVHELAGRSLALLIAIRSPP
jgi:hypothetical protein